MKKLIDLRKNLTKEIRLLKKSGGKAIFFSFIVGLFVVSAIVSYFYFHYQSVFVRSKDINKPTEAHLSPGPSPSPTPPVYTFALLGYGGAGHDGGRLTDSIMVIKIDTGIEKIGIISVPRDSWIQLPSNGWENEKGWKVNAAYAIGFDDDGYPRKPDEFTGEAGGGTMAKYALEQVIGFPVDYFVAVDFTGFKRAVDVLGGINVRVSRPFTDPKYPIPGEEDNPCDKTEEEIAETTATLSGELLEKEFPCRFEELSFAAGAQLMDGETALKYARSRHAPADGGDFNRARRQREVLFAARDRILALDFIPKIIPFMNTISSHVQTDIPLDRLRWFFGERERFLEYDIVSIPLTTAEENTLKLGVSSDRQSIVMPKDASNAAEIDWQSVHEFIDEQLMASESAELDS